MRIVEEREPFTVEYDQLDEGDVFRYPFSSDNEPRTFMKCEGSHGAIDLSTGRFHCFTGEARCEPLDAKLIISPRVG